jgi:hypothetical protein
MDKNKIIALSDYTFAAITEFYKTHKGENIPSSFSNWNAKDVIGHILFWVDFSRRKLDCIKNCKPFDDISDLDKTNKEAYEKSKNVPVTTLFQKAGDVFSGYKEVMKLYTDDELLKKTFPSGFPFELWRYMALDVYIHPIMHLLHYYLKTEDYTALTSEVNNCINNFLEYANNDISIFNFNEFYENSIERISQFEKLKEKIKNNEIIESIIKVNIQEK